MAAASAALAARMPWRRAGTRRRPLPRTPNYVLLLAVVLVLELIGLVMVLSASSVQALRDTGNSWYYFNRQLLWVSLGTAAMLVASRLDYHRWRRFGTPLLAVSAVLMAVVLVPGVGITVGGSSRWLGAGPFRMQPSELAKLGLLLVVADLLTRRGDRMDQTHVTVRPVLWLFAPVGVLLMLQPDLGTTLVSGAIVMAVLFVAGAPLPTLVTLTGMAAGGTLLLAKIEPYRWQRMTSFLDPWADASNTGYQAAQGIVALASGGIAGVGLGASRAKWGFLPAAHTDFIFAIIGEELGIIGALAVVALFAGLAVLGVRIAIRAGDRYGALLAGGATAWITVQAVINMGAVVGLLPITGVPLPFVSLGGSSLVISMATVGILLNVSRRPATSKSRRPARAAGA